MSRALPSAAVVLSALLLAAPARAGEPGVYWEETMETEMVGMPYAMPPQTVKICMPNGAWTRPPETKQEKNCQVKDMKVVGDVMTWKVVCTGENAMTAEGQMTRGAETFSGNMKMVMAQGTMNTKIKGRKVGGACDTDEQKRKAEAMSQEMKSRQQEAQKEQADREAELCASALKSMSVAAVAGRSPYCKDPAKKAEFCARLKTVQGYSAVENQAKAEQQTNGMIPGPKAAAEVCGVDLTAIKAELCAKGERVGSLDFLATHCPEQAKVLARRECAGRDYTARQASPYRDFCSRMVGDELDTGAAPPPKPAPKAKSPQDEAAEKARKALKGAFGF
jgi:hypothetical protein